MKRLHLKDDVAFSLFITIYPQMVTMFDELDNLLKLDTILNGKLVGLKNHVDHQHNNNIENNNNNKRNKS
jgi:hypothetical protein